jgi:hypothetical protein
MNSLIQSQGKTFCPQQYGRQIRFRLEEEDESENAWIRELKTNQRLKEEKEEEERLQREQEQRQQQ